VKIQVEVFWVVTPGLSYRNTKLRHNQEDLDLKVHYHVHNTPLLFSIYSHVN
jgi:hypothetical protein